MTRWHYSAIVIVLTVVCYFTEIPVLPKLVLSYVGFGAGVKYFLRMSDIRSIARAAANGEPI